MSIIVVVRVAVVYGIYNQTSSVITINGGSIDSSAGKGIYSGGSGKIVINGGSIKAGTGIQTYYGTVEINDVNIIATSYGIDNRATTIMKNGNITVFKSSSTCYGIYNNYGQITLGELDETVPSTEHPSITASSETGTAYGLSTTGTVYFYDGIINGSKAAISGETIETPEHYRVGLRNNGTTAVLEIVSDFDNTIQANGIFYASLQEAVNAISESNSKEGTILLWDDLRSLTDGVIIPENVEVTIALEGHIIQFQDLSTAITNNGTLNIIDFEDIEEGDSDTTSIVKNTTGIVITNNGTLTIGQEGNKNANSPVIEGVPAVSGIEPEIKSGKLVNTTVSGASGSLNSIYKIAGSRKNLLSGILEILGNTRLSSEVDMKPSSRLPDWTKNDVNVDLSASTFGILNLYLGEKVIKPKDISYTVEYYKVDVKIEEDTVVKTETVLETDPDTLTLDRTLITNNDKYYGYCIDRTEPATVPDTVNHGDVIKVYYKIDETKVKELSYTVEYYKANVKVEEDTVITKQNVQILQPDTITIDRNLVNNNDKYYGYCIDRTEPNTVPDVVNTGTTIKVYYKIDTTKTKELNYTVEYYKANVKVTSDTVVRRQTVQVLQPDTIAIDRTLLTNNSKYYGYCLDRTEPSTVPDTVNTGTIIKVYYKVDNNQTKQLSYTVEYYKDGAKVTGDTIVRRETVQVLQPDTIMVDRSLITNNNKYTNYCIERTNPDVVPERVNSGTTIKVYYMRVGSPTKQLSYTVEYYKNEALMSRDTVTRRVTVQTSEPDTLPIDRSLITNNNKYYGYCIDRTDPEIVPDVVDTGTIVRVYYKIDETQTKEIFYTVDYYKEHVKVEEDTVIIRETVQVLYPDMLDFDRSLITDNDKYPGYCIEEIDPAEVPDRVHNKQIISVNYEIDETKTKDLSYTVEYYKDNIQMEEDTVVVTEAVQILLPDILPLDMSLVTNNDKYPGYCIERTDPEMLSNRVHDGDVIKVYYVIDSMQTKELSYTVEYYKDNNKVEEDTIIITKRVHLLDVDTIETERTLFTDNDKYLGYHLERTEPEEVPEVVDNGTVIKVYYEKTAYAYRVEYYYNGQIDESLTEQGTAYLGDTIQECPSKPKEGYEFDGTENLPLEISLVRENVIRVYYVAVRKVTVEHIEKETEEVLEQEVKVGKQGTLIRTEARKIEGYTLVEKPEKEEYILGNEDMVVRYYYEKVKQEPEPTPQEDEKEPEEEQPTPTEPEERQEEPEPKETHVIPVTPDEPTIDNTTTPTKLPRTGYHRIIIPLVWVITIAGLVFYNKYQSIGKKKKKK